MMIYIKILAETLIIISTFAVVLSTTCVEVTNPKVRTFSTLTELQTNKIMFDPSLGNGGNYVNFSFQAISALPKNAFITLDSEHIIKIILNDKSIGKINNGAFTSLTCLKYLDLSHNKISLLDVHTFDGIGNLVSLDLNNNLLTTIPDLVFDKLGRLKILNLSHNKISTLNYLSFANLTNLEELYLGFNYLMKIPEEVFDPLVKLSVLDITGNHLVAKESTKWNLKTLRSLNFAANHLKSFDPSLNYSYTDLSYLNLSSNHLTDLNVYWLRLHFNNLTILDLNHNEWLCDDLARIIHELADSHVTLYMQNKTTTNVAGVDCLNSTADYIPVPDDVNPALNIQTESTAVIKTAPPVIVKTSNLLSEKLFDQLRESNNKVLDKISSMNGLLALMFIFMIGCALAMIFFSCGVGKQFAERMHMRLNPTSVNADYSLLRT